MAAMTANTLCAGLRDNELLEPKIPPLKTGLDDGNEKLGYTLTGSKWRCDTFCMQRDPTVEVLAPLLHWVCTQVQTSLNLIRLLDHILRNFTSKHLPTAATLALRAAANLPQSRLVEVKQRNYIVRDIELVDFAKPSSDSHDDPPPSYIESQADLPPLYAQIDPSIYPPKPSTPARCPKGTRSDIVSWQNWWSQPRDQSVFPQMPVPDLDFDDSSNFRQAAGKKNKKGQQGANQSSWADPGDEGNKDGADGEKHGGVGGGSNNGDGGAGGAGGAGGDGGGDDWGNDWNAPKKKKGKKGKSVDEEEEKKKQEEEERKKEEEEAALNGDPLDWANEVDTNANDDWEGFTSTTKKGKKNKKDKDKVGLCIF